MPLIMNGTTIQSVVYNGVAITELVYNTTSLWTSFAAPTVGFALGSCNVQPNAIDSGWTAYNTATLLSSGGTVIRTGASVGKAGASGVGEKVGEYCVYMPRYTVKPVKFVSGSENYVAVLNKNGDSVSVSQFQAVTSADNGFNVTGGASFGDKPAVFIGAQTYIGPNGFPLSYGASHVINSSGAKVGLTVSYAQYDNYCAVARAGSYSRGIVYSGKVGQWTTSDGCPNPVSNNRWGFDSSGTQVIANANIGTARGRPTSNTANKTALFINGFKYATSTVSSPHTTISTRFDENGNMIGSEFLFAGVSDGTTDSACQHRIDPAGVVSGDFTMDMNGGASIDSLACYFRAYVSIYVGAKYMFQSVDENGSVVMAASMISAPVVSSGYITGGSA